MQFKIFIIQGLFLSFSLFATSIPQRLDRGILYPGDIVGVSSRRALTGFMVQSATRSPIDHVAIVLRENHKTFLFHRTSEGILKDTIPEFLSRYKTKGGSVYFIHARTAFPLNSAQLSGLGESVSQAIASGYREPSCSHFIQRTFAAIGLSVGSRVSIAEYEMDAFGGFLIDHWKRIFRDIVSAVPPYSLFQKGTRVVQGNVPLFWTQEEMISAWENTGDASQVSRLYFGSKEPRVSEFFRAVKATSCISELL